MTAPRSSWCCIVALSLAAAHAALAFSPSISPSAPKVGQRITLTYKINDLLSLGGGEPYAPTSISAGGISFSRTDMKESRVGAYNYLRVTYVGVADQSGSFRIPSKKFRAGGKSFTSESVTFQIGGKTQAKVVEEKPLPDFSRARSASTPFTLPPAVSAARSVASPAPRPTRSPLASAPRPKAPQAVATTVVPAAAPPSPAPTAAATPPLRAQDEKGSMVISAAEAFVGQSVPITLEFPLRADDQFEGPLTRPTLAGEGFTGSEWQPRETATITTNGVAYNLIVLDGTFVPFQAGVLKMPDLALTGRRLQGGALTPGFAGKFPAPAGGGWKDYSIVAEGREINVMDLPAEGRPKGFNGAVGLFSTLPLEVSTRSPEPGQPVTLKVRVRLQPGSDPRASNMTSVSGPDLVHGGEWRIHGPKEEFDPGQMIKSFEYTLVARAKTAKSPSALLHYFDPLQKKYLTLEWPAVDIDAEGAVQESNPAETARTREAEPPGSAVPASRPAAFSWPDLSSIPWKTIRGAAFWPLSLLVFTFLFFWAARLFLRRRREAGELLKASLSEAWDRFEEAHGDPAAFYAAAAGVISARLALLRGKAAATDDLGEQLNRLVTNVPLREDLAAIIARRDELNYGAAEPVALRPDERETVCASLEKFCEDVA